MKIQVAVMLVILCACAFAQGNAALAPVSVKSGAPAVSGTDAITIPYLFSYQGKLTDTFGIPVMDTTHDVEFRLYTQPTGGTTWWSETQSVRTRGGLFSVLVGDVEPIEGVPDEGALYLTMTVNGGAELSPRIHLGSVPYAYKTERAGYADLLQGKDTTGFVRTGQANSVTSAMITNATIVAADLNQMGATTSQVLKWNGSAWGPANDSAGGGGDNAWVRGSPDSVLFTAHQVGLCRGGAYNLMQGTHNYADVNFGTHCTTGYVGTGPGYITVSGGGDHDVSEFAATIGGGLSNRVSGSFGTIPGGDANKVSGDYAGISGGSFNCASGNYSTVGGGRTDSAQAMYGGVFSGYSNAAGIDAGDTAACVVGGRANRATEMFSCVGGGLSNWAGGQFSAVSGGRNDSAQATYGGVFSGYGNSAGINAGDTAACVVGGRANRATEMFSCVGGGLSNWAGGQFSAVSGGRICTANGDYSAVPGGYNNSASGNYSAVPGGRSNIASAVYSFAADSGSMANYGHSAAFNGTTTSALRQLRCYVMAQGFGGLCIDDPRDPKGAIINQYSVGSSEALLTYRGAAIVGAGGRVTVSLPDYFDVLNRNPMVQLTGVGTSDVYVAEDVSGNSFAIGGRPGTKVYWTVTGERKDDVAADVRATMPVEQQKTDDLRGRSVNGLW